MDPYDLTIEVIEKTLAEREPEHWLDFEEITRYNCHSASLALVTSGLLPHEEGWRVARGACTGVSGQHSWAVRGDPYGPGCDIVDISAWSYDKKRPNVWVTANGRSPHRPHGLGSIWQHGAPTCGEDEGVELTPSTPLSQEARLFLDTVAAVNGRKGRGIDYRGWSSLANSPMQGWPSGEIITAMYETAGVRPLVPIDIVGMLTDFNPDGLYW